MSQKILVLSHMYPNPVNWQSGIFVHNQCKALVRAGNEVQVISPTPSFPFYSKWNGYKQLPSRTKVEEIPVHYVPTRMFPGGFFFSRYGYFYLNSLLPVIQKLQEEFPFDCIHCHTIFPDGNCGVRLKDFFQVPVLSTIHGSDIMLYPKRSKGVYHQTLYALKKSDQIITVSQRLQAEAESMADGLPIKTIYNGFDAERFRPGDKQKARQELGLPINKKIFLYVGNLYPVKGVPYLLKAFSKVVAHTKEAHLVLVGDGHLKTSLQKEAIELGLDGMVSWMGRRPYEEIPKWLHSTDAVVLSSLSEGLPSILLESMACRRPMIATDVGGISEVLQDRVTGRLVPPKNPEKLAEAFLEVIDHEKQLEEMGEKAFQLSRAYTWEENVRQLEQCYQALSSSKIL